ncbi:hypothetical protein [Paenibacillus phocaensis]|uniref:hypothetical protein n=1 Tax=Paenibacillus phocaensis TaxID=1776378 RepID=UPI000839B339|nr:hypothetical protein [Paenibacillus phocaensis]
MLNPVRSLVWLLFSVSSFIAAALYTLEIGGEPNASYDALAAQLHGVQRSVYAHEGEELVHVRNTGGHPGYGDPLERSITGITGNDLLHRIPDWINVGARIELDGVVLNAASNDPMEDLLERSRERALAVLDLRAEYEAERIFDSSGEVIRVIIHRK